MLRTWALASVGLAALALGSTSFARADSAPAWAYPSSTRTDVAVVDDVIAAVTSGDAEALRATLDFRPLACQANPGLGGVQCPPGTAEGTVIPVVMGGSCELNGVIESEVNLTVVARPGLYLHSVARLGGKDPASDPDYPELDYALFFGGESDPGVAGGTGSFEPVMFGLTSDGVFQMSGGCASSVADQAARQVAGWLLAPRDVEPTSTATKVAPTAPPTGTGTTVPRQSPSDIPLFAAVAGLLGAGAIGALAARRRR